MEIASKFFQRSVFCKRLIYVTLICNLKPLSVNSTKWPNTLKQFVGKLPTNCSGKFDHFVKLTLKGLKQQLAYNLLTAKNKYFIYL